MDDRWLVGRFPYLDAVFAIIAQADSMMAELEDMLAYDPAEDVETLIPSLEILLSDEYTDDDLTHYIAYIGVPRLPDESPYETLLYWRDVIQELLDLRD